MGFANDSASSVKVGSNVKLTLFEHDSYNGRSETFQTDDSDLRNNTIGNDAASSMKVESRSGGGNNGGTSSAYRLPFVGTYAIMTGPGCYWTHTAKSSEAMDFAMSVNTSVIATQSGKVVFASWDNTGFGNLIKIQHADNNVSWYGHLSKFDVSVGATVQRGQTIARSGSSGNSTGPHLHFEIRNQQDQSISIRNLPGVTLYNPSGNPPCKPPGQPDGTATGSAN